MYAIRLETADGTKTILSNLLFTSYTEACDWIDTMPGKIACMAVVVKVG